MLVSVAFRGRIGVTIGGTEGFGDVGLPVCYGCLKELLRILMALEMLVLTPSEARVLSEKGHE